MSIESRLPEIRNAVKEGLTRREISKKLDIKYSTLTNGLRKHQIHVENITYPYPVITQEMVGDVRAAAVANYTRDEIADYAEIDYDTATRIIRNEGISVKRKEKEISDRTLRELRIMEGMIEFPKNKKFPTLEEMADKIGKTKQWASKILIREGIYIVEERRKYRKTLK